MATITQRDRKCDTRIDKVWATNTIVKLAIPLEGINVIYPIWNFHNFGTPYQKKKKNWQQSHSLGIQHLDWAKFYQDGLSENLGNVNNL